MANIAVNVWDFGPLETFVMLLHKRRISTAKKYFKTIFDIIFIKYKEEILAITTVNEFLRFQTKPIMQINIIQITMKLEATWEDQNIIQIYGVDRRLNYTSKVGYATII